MNVSRLRLTDQKRPGRVTGVHIVHGPTRKKERRMRRHWAELARAMVKSSRRPVRRAHAKDSKASSAAEARHASSSARSRGAKRRWTVCGSGLKTTVQGKFPGLGHKIGAHPMWPDC